VSFPQIGFRSSPRVKDILRGFLYGIGMLLISGGLQFALQLSLHALAGPGPTQELKEVTSKLTAEHMLEENRSPAMFATMLIIAGVLAPFSEEVFFRGFLYNTAKKRFGIIAGVLISSLVFAAAHFGPLAVIGIVPMGILLALAYEKTGSLWVPITMHATNNLIAVTLSYLYPKSGF
jgi:membrane protease YdiL (CAAX protease family)